MSYNCDTFKVKKLENLKIPVKSLYKAAREDWHPDRVENDDGTVTFWNCETTVKGSVKDGILTVQEIDCCGEGSGVVMNDILEPAFEDSTGELIASCVWEGGDCINHLIVKDGKVKWEEIEI
jgi:hypothetical protein